MPQAPPSFAFEPLFERLRQEGFALGIDHQIRVQQLLDRLAEDIKADDLKTLLCPLFATNRAQQEKFYQIFDELFHVEVEEAAKGNFAAPVLGTIAQPPWWKRLLRSRWIYLAMVPLAAAGLWWWLQPPLKPETKPEVKPPFELEPPKPVTPDKQQPLPPVRPHAHLLEFPLPANLPLSPEDAQTRAIQWVTVISPLLMFGAYWLYRRVRKAIADRGPTGRPPHFWAIQCPPLGEALFRTPAVRELARHMRRRQPVEDQVLDVMGTIRATIGSLGFPRFQYAALRRPTEWVVLIEQRSHQDHFAHMMTELARVLKAEDVLLSRYYFERDPRRLTTDSGDEILLSNLAGRTTGARVLVFGSSGNLVHPVTGRLEEWASIFEAWPMRALLLADAPRERRRKRLEGAGFALAPASVKGAKAVVDFFEDGGAQSGRAWPRFEPLDQPPTEDDVRGGAGGPAIEWLAACAVYPEINWNLSLRLGSVLRPLDESEASKLARIEWLRESLIPPVDRERLWERIPEEKRAGVQQSIGELLQLHQPPKDSFAWESWQYALRLYRPPKPPSLWQRARDWARGGTELAPDAAPDAVFLRFMDWRPVSRRAFRLPAGVENWLYEDGLRGLGMRAAAWLPVAIVAALLLGGVLRPWTVDANRMIAGTVVGPAGEPVANVQVAGQNSDAAGRFRIPAVGTALVEAKHPLWPQSVDVGDAGLVVRVSPGRPKSRPFRLVEATIVTPIQLGEETAISLEYAGELDLNTVSFSSSANAAEPYLRRESSEDGAVFYFKPDSSRIYTATVDGRRYPGANGLAVIVRTAKDPPSGEADERLLSFAKRYEDIRKSMPSGDKRTQILDGMVAEIRALAKQYDAVKLPATLFAKNEEGLRIVALGLAQGAPGRQHLNLALQAIGKPRSAFEQFHGLVLAQAILTELTGAQRQQLLAVVQAAVAGKTITPEDQSRWQPAQELLEALGNAAASVGGQVRILYLSDSQTSQSEAISGWLEASQFSPITQRYERKAIAWPFRAPVEIHYFRASDRNGADKIRVVLAEHEVKSLVRLMPVAAVPPWSYEVWLLDPAGDAPKPGEQRPNPRDGLTYVWIPPGEFIMGCSPGDKECYRDESPAHAVTITKGFWMSKSEVTQAAYEKVIGSNPSNFKSPLRPVEQVSWAEARDYCGKIGGRLPTEAEWEYAARAGSTAARYGDLDQIAWHGGNSKATTHDVMTKAPNAFGLHDMFGNVFEWVADWYGPYSGGAGTDPMGAGSGTSRILRGGSWNDLPQFVRGSIRLWYVPSLRYNSIGVRCAGEVR